MTSVKDNSYFGMLISDFGFNRRVILLCSLIILAMSSIFAQEIKLPERPNPPRLVNDYAGMLSEGDAEALEGKLVGYSRETSIQIAIVIIPTLGGAEINQFATELFHKWGIGEKGKDNGVLLLIAKDDRKLFISTGRGVEEFLPDAICKRIVELTIKPEFKTGNYAQGINAGVDEMQARLTGQFKNDKPDAAPVKFKISWIIYAIIIIIVLIVLFGGGGNNGQTHSGIGSSAAWFLLGALSNRGSSGGGWGGGDSGGGGFGGFGGGDSGGGGAGGDW
jgi:uncharacterized protein